MEHSLRRLEQQATVIEKYVSAGEHERAAAELYQLLHLLVRSDGWAKISAEWMKEFSERSAKVLTHSRALVQRMGDLVRVLQREVAALPERPDINIRHVRGYQEALKACRDELPYLLDISETHELAKLLLFPIKQLFAELPVRFYFSCIELAFFLLHASGNGDKARSATPALESAFAALDPADQESAVRHAERIRQQTLAQAEPLFRYPPTNQPMHALRRLVDEKPCREIICAYYAESLPAASAELRELGIEPSIEAADFPALLGERHVAVERDILFSHGPAHPSWTCFELAGVCGFPIEEVCPSLRASTEDSLLPTLIANHAARARIGIGDNVFRIGPSTPLLVAKLLGELRLGLETRHRISALLDQYKRRLLFAPIPKTKGEVSAVRALCAWLVDQGLRPISTSLPGDETDVQHDDEFVIEAKLIRPSELSSKGNVLKQSASVRLEHAVVQLREYGDRRGIRERYLVIFNSCPGLKLVCPSRIGDDVVVCAIDLGPLNPSRLKGTLRWEPAA